jgi:hypothetical protein
MLRARERFGQRELHVTQVNRFRLSMPDRRAFMQWQVWRKRLAVAMLLPDLIPGCRMD